MKRLFLTFVYLLFVSFLYSQFTKEDVKEVKSNEKSLLVGFKGGPTLSSFSREVLDWKYVLKHSSGISIRYLINQKFSFETGISYEAKGASDNIIFTEEKIYYNCNYLTLPMLASVYFGEKTKFGANLGPYFSYLISYSVHYYFPPPPNNIDLGIILGLYSKIKLTEKILINLEIRNSLGFLGPKYYGGGYAINWKNQTHTLLLGLEYLIN